MRWFKHMTNMRNDLFVKKLISLYGLEGKAVWDLVLEIYAEFCTEKNCGDWIEFDRIIFRKEIGISDKKMEKFLNFFAENSKLFLKISPEIISIKIPKMLDFRDEWTKKNFKNSGVTPEQLTLQRIDNREQKTEEKKQSKKIESDSDFFDFAQKGQSYASQSGNPNMHNFSWISGYLQTQFTEIRNSRPDIPAEAVLQVWQQCCDDASAKSVGAPKWYRTTFENRLANWNPSVKSNYATRASSPVSQPKKHSHIVAWEQKRRFFHIGLERTFEATELEPINYTLRRSEGVKELDAFRMPDGRISYFVDFVIEEAKL